MFHPPLPVVPQKVKPQTVGGLIDLPNQVRPHPHPPRRVHQALEHRILHSLPLVFAHLPPPPQSPPPFPRLRTDIVRHHHQHHRVASLISLPQKRRVPVEIAAHKPRQQHRLDVRCQPKRHPLLQERVQNLFLFPFLVRHQHFLPRRIIHHHAAALRLSEPTRLHLPPVHQRERQPVGPHRPHFLHQVQSLAGPPRPVPVQIPHRRVQPHGFQRGRRIVYQQRVDE